MSSWVQFGLVFKTYLWQCEDTELHLVTPTPDSLFSLGPFDSRYGIKLAYLRPYKAVNALISGG